MHRGNIGTGAFFASDPAAANPAKPVRAFGGAGTNLTPELGVPQVTTKPSVFTNIDKPKALPDRRWQSVQWQA
jgi:hypothetical protein